MNWCTIDTNYINYLKKFDTRIPNIEYGKYKFKPFFAPLFTKGNLTYVTQISSKKDRHLKLKEQIDFIKIFDEKNKNLLGVVNLNYMFPVPTEKIINIKYKEIEQYRSFISEKEKNSYIYLLKIEIKKIKEKKVDISAKKLYEIVRINPIISKRCLNFTFLEEKALEYDNYIKENSKKEKKKEDVSQKNEKTEPWDKSNSIDDEDIDNPWAKKLQSDKENENSSDLER